MYTYSPEEDFTEDCYQCETKRKTIYSAIDYLDELVKRLYISDQTDILKIQIALDNLCQCLGVKTIDGEINIQPKQIDWLNIWVDENNAYLKSFAKTKIAIGE